jgi:hypothetical protein
MDRAFIGRKLLGVFGQCGFSLGALKKVCSAMQAMIPMR